MNIEKALPLLLAHEGGYSNNPADPGGETMFGVTKRVANENGYYGVMRELPLAKAVEIYKKKYWEPCQCDRLPDLLKFQVFDASVNSGPTQAIKWLQQMLGIPADGLIGPQTLVAIDRCDNFDEFVLKYNAIRLTFLTGLPTWPNFGKGWARRIAKNLTIGE
jgi:lysozyme family protein